MTRTEALMRFTLWALTHKAIPSEREIAAELGINYKTASRWLGTWKPIRAEIEGEV